MPLSPKKNKVIKFIRSGFYVYPISKMDDDELDILEDTLTYRDPKAHFTKGKSKVCLMEDGGAFPFGLFTEVKRKLPFDIKLDKIGERGKVFPISDKLREYQREALTCWYRKKQGIIKIVTRGGKTFVLAEAINKIYEEITKDEKICILVDSSDLLKQTVKTLEEETGLTVEGYGGGMRKTREQREYQFDADVQVFMVQSLQGLFSKPKRTKKVRGRLMYKAKATYDAEVLKWKANRKKFRNYVEKVKFLCVDEVHEFGSSLRTDIVMCFENIEWGMYLSATPYRDSDPVAAKRIQGYSGGIVTVIDEQKLVDEGFLAERIAILIEYENPEIEDDLDVMIEPYEKWIDKENAVTGKVEEIFVGYDMEAYNLIESEYMEDNDERNLILKCILKVLIELDVKTLAMSGIVKHVELLGKLVGKPYISGKDGLSKRDKHKIDLLKGELNMLICSEIWKKGITLPQVQAFVNCDGGKEASLFRQKKGRVLGNSEDGVQDKALIIDIMDFYQPFFGNHSINRLEVLTEDMGVENIVFIKWRGRNKKRKFIKELREEIVNWFELKQ